MTSRGRRIIVIDDDAAICRALSRVLRIAHFDVQTFTSASEFLNGPMPGADDILVIDIDIAGVNGVELRGILRAKNCESPIIFITAHHREHISQAVGTEPVLLKPLEADVLLSAIRRARPALRSHPGPSSS